METGLKLFGKTAFYVKDKDGKFATFLRKREATDLPRKSAARSCRFDQAWRVVPLLKTHVPGPPHPRGSGPIVTKPNTKESAGFRMMQHSTLAVAGKIGADETTPPPGADAQIDARMAAAAAPDTGSSAPAALEVDWRTPATSWSIRLLSLAAGLVMWHLACVNKLHCLHQFRECARATVVVKAFWPHLHELKFYIHILASMQRILISFALATFVGIVPGRRHRPLQARP